MTEMSTHNLCEQYPLVRPIRKPKTIMTNLTTEGSPFDFINAANDECIEFKRLKPLVRMSRRVERNTDLFTEIWPREDSLRDLFNPVHGCYPVCPFVRERPTEN